MMMSGLNAVFLMINTARWWVIWECEVFREERNVLVGLQYLGSPGKLRRWWIGLYVS